MRLYLDTTKGMAKSGPRIICPIAAELDGFDPTRGVSITVNIGTAVSLYTLHGTFDPLSLRGSKVKVS